MRGRAGARPAAGSAAGSTAPPALQPAPAPARLAEGAPPGHLCRMTGGIGIRVNGEERRVAAATVAALLAELGLPAQKVAVERNLEIVPRSLYAETRLAPGDAIEIVHFIGGG